jgi:hypothetical protein
MIEDVPLDAAARRRVIEAVLSTLKQSYVYPETAEKMAAAIHDNQQKGKYDGITDGGLLANQLDGDLRAVSHDRHLHVEYSPFKPPSQRQGPDPAAEARQAERTGAQQLHLREARDSPGKLGLCEIQRLPPS